MGSISDGRRRRRAAVAWCMAVGLAGLVGCSVSTTAPPRPKPVVPRVSVSAEARAAIEGMAAFLGGKKGFAFRQTSATTTTPADEGLAAKVAGTMEHTVRVERPTRIHVAITGDRKGGGTVSSDGTNLVIHDAAKNRWESNETPGTLAELVAHPLVAGLLAIGSGDTANRAFFAEAPVDALLEGTREVVVAGTEAIDGKECTHLAAKTEGSGWDLWIANGAEPVPVKFVPASSRMSFGGKDFEVVTTVSFDQWRFDPVFTADDFAFTPPEGAEKVDSILGAADDDVRRRVAARPSLHSTVGFPAPKATLIGLDGERFDPVAHKGKIVVLDFWATWCGPCRVTLPIVARVCKDYAEKGVVFRAVDVKEDAETVKTFLGEESIDATVVLDASGDTLAAYRVEAIPHTVIIGTDGLVQAVHVGASDDLEEKLRKQLDALGEGKSLLPRSSGNVGPRAEPP